MGEVTTISFVVPSEHAMEFQRRGFTLLEELTAAAPVAAGSGPERAFVPADSAEVRGTDVWKMAPWTPEDHERAEWVAGHLPDHPFRALTYLCENPDRWVRGREIADALGLEHGAKSVPPSFKSMANRCRRVYRAPMWRWDNQHGYKVDASVGELFRPYLQSEQV